jgi:HAD superfamily hydrolase (TIGR01509 family)
MKRLLLKSVALTLCIATSLSYGAHVVFDGDGVLFSNNKISTIWKIGPTNFIGNPVHIMNIRKLMFHFLSGVEPQRPENPTVYHQGMVMPQIMCDWQMGIKTPEQVRAQIADHMKTPKAALFFDKYGCRNAITGRCNFMFDSEKFASSMDVIDDGAQLLKQCKAAGHKVYILSNYPKEAFPLLSKSNPKIKELVDLCDGVYISGELGVMKPNGQIFVDAFKKANIDADAEVTVFFDDEPANVAAAQGLGKKKLYAAQVPHKKYDQAYGLLKDLKLL